MQAQRIQQFKHLYNRLFDEWDPKAAQLVLTIMADYDDLECDKLIYSGNEKLNKLRKYVYDVLNKDYTILMIENICYVLKNPNLDYDQVANDLSLFSQDPEFVMSSPTFVDYNQGYIFS